MDVEGGGKGQDRPSTAAQVPQYDRTPVALLITLLFQQESEPANRMSKVAGVLQVRD